jgi:hypothetical protein
MIKNWPTVPRRIALVCLMVAAPIAIPLVHLGVYWEMLVSCVQVVEEHW